MGTAWLSHGEMGSYTNKVTNENNLCKLPTYAQKLFLRDLVTYDSFISSLERALVLSLIMLQAQTVPGLEHHLESQGEKTNHQLQ